MSKSGPVFINPGEFWRYAAKHWKTEEPKTDLRLIRAEYVLNYVGIAIIVRRKTTFLVDYLTEIVKIVSLSSYYDLENIRTYSLDWPTEKQPTLFKVSLKMGRKGVRRQFVPNSKKRQFVPSVNSSHFEKATIRPELFN